MHHLEMKAKFLMRKGYILIEYLAFYDYAKRDNFMVKGQIITGSISIFRQNKTLKTTEMEFI